MSIKDKLQNLVKKINHKKETFRYEQTDGDKYGIQPGLARVLFEKKIFDNKENLIRVDIVERPHPDSRTKQETEEKLRTSLSVEEWQAKNDEWFSRKEIEKKKERLKKLAEIHGDKPFEMRDERLILTNVPEGGSRKKTEAVPLMKFEKGVLVNDGANVYEYRRAHDDSGRAYESDHKLIDKMDKAGWEKAVEAEKAKTQAVLRKAKEQIKQH